MPRTARLLVLSPDGSPEGVLGPYAVESPWWPDVEPVVTAAREQCGADVLVLRLLPGLSAPPAAEPGAAPQASGGAVTYLAQATAPLDATSRRALAPVAGLLGRDALTAALADDPLRAAWARPGGVAGIASWAQRTLAAAGRPATGPVEQVKTWNLSSILRLPTAHGPVWCKSVPGFMAHETAVLQWVARRRPRLVPEVLGADPSTGTVLLADLPGEDQWAAPSSRLVEMIEATVDLQATAAGHVAALLALGLPDWRGGQLAAALAALTGRADVRRTLTPDELDQLDTLVATLPRLVAEVSASGLPDTLVHGDLHPGNWRFGPRGLRLLDWGDSGVGHPLLDLPAFVGRVPPEHRPSVESSFGRAWRRHVPAADPQHATAVVRPLAALRQALVYQGFLDRIEQDEHVYHRGDVPWWLRAALRGRRPVGP